MRRTRCYIYMCCTHQAEHYMILSATCTHSTATCCTLHTTRWNSVLYTLHDAHHTHPTPTLVLVYMIHTASCTLLHTSNCMLKTTRCSMPHIIVHCTEHKCLLIPVYCHCSENITYEFLEHSKQHPHPAAWYTLHTILYCIHYTMMHTCCPHCYTHYTLSYTPR